MLDTTSTHADAGDPTKINFDELRNVAERLKSSGHIVASEQMRSLVASLESDSGRSLGPWANVDVFSVFSVSELARALNPQGKIAHGIEGLRNVGIFAPLLLTWWRLSSIPPGVDFRDAILGSGGVGTEIFIVLGLLVGFSIVSEWIERRRALGIAQDEKHLTHLLRPVSLSLSAARAGQPAELIEQFRSMSTELRLEMETHFQNVQAMAVERGKEIADLKLLNDSLSSQMAAMKSVGEVTSSSVSRVQNAIGDLVQHTERLINNENSLTVQMRKMADELTVVGDKHQAGSIALKEQTEALGRSVRTLDTAITDVGKLVPTLLNNTGSLSKMYGEFLDRMTDQTHVQREFTEKLEAAASGMADAGPQIARVSTAIDEIRRETSRLATAIDQSNQGTSQMVSVMSAAAKTHELAAQRFDVQTTSQQTAIVTLESSLTVLDRSVTGLVAAADGIGKMHVTFLDEMADLATHQRDFAGDLGAAVQEMKGVAPAFDKINNAVETLREQIRTLNAQLGQTSKDTDASLRKIEGLAAAQTKSADAFSKVVEGQHDLVISLDRTQTQLVTVGRNIEAALRSVDAVQQSFQDRFTQIVDKEQGVFDALKTTLETTSRNAPPVADFGKQLTEARSSLGDFIARLNGISSELIRVQDQLVSFKDRVGRP